MGPTNGKLSVKAKFFDGPISRNLGIKAMPFEPSLWSVVMGNWQSHGGWVSLCFNLHKM